MENESIKATFKQTIFASSDSLFKVILVKNLATEKTETVSGSFQPLEEGLSYKFEGYYKTHIKYGKQFFAERVTLIESNYEGLISYLSSDRFKGIGKAIATEIVDVLGLDAINKILEDETCLDSIKKLNKAKKTILVETLKSNHLQDKVFVELYSYGLTNRMVYKLFENYGMSITDRIKENPYFLIYDCEGFGFLKCDKIALGMGFKKTNPIRLKEALIYNLSNECYQNGHVFILIDDLISSTLKLLGFDDSFIKILHDNVLELVKENRIISVENRIYPKNLFLAEENVAKRLLAIKDKPVKSFSDSDIDDAYKYSQASLNISYTPLQCEALKKIFTEKIAIITGGPGTGKTTIVKGLLQEYSSLTGKDLDSDEFSVLLCAPTGRAAKRLSEATKYGASTIHKALGYTFDGGFSFNIHNKLPYSLIIIDEASMIDIELASILLDAISDRARVIFIGDENQLPSVAPGEFLHDIIHSNQFRTFRLKEIMRQVSDSNIIKLSNMVLNQKIDRSVFNTKKEIFYYSSDSKGFQGRLQLILDAYFKRTEGNLDDIEVLIPMYAGLAGIDQTNDFIQRTYNKNDSFIISGDRIFYKGDKILQLQNDPEKQIMNGDIGYILEIVKRDDKDIIKADFNHVIVDLERKDLENITLAYAISIHKSQGSEYKNVILPLFQSYSIMLKKKLIYTAITRAKEKLIIVGDLSLLDKKIVLRESLRNTTLIRLLAFENDSDERIITDPLSAFDYIGEELNGLTPYDFF